MKHVGNWVCVALLSVLVVGCVSFGPVGAGELIGEWAGTVTRDADGGTMEVAFEFRDDGTFAETIASAPVTFSGTYSVDPVASTLNVTITESSNESIVAPGTSLAQGIEISGDGNTFKASGSGSSGVFERQ